MAYRSDLVMALRELDAEITTTLKYPKSSRAAERAKELFRRRSTLVCELEALGIDPDEHPALHSRP